MRARHHSPSSSSDDERRTEPLQYHVRYVRHRPSPKRSNSYERRRPSNHHRDSSSGRRRPDVLSDDSDDDTVYKVDQHGRRYHIGSVERAKRRERHAGGGNTHHMSGALLPDVEPTTDRQSSTADAMIITEESPGRWSTIAGPFKINVFDAKESQKAEQEHCMCRRCHRGRPGSRHDRHRTRSSRSSRSKSGSSRSVKSKSGSPGPRGILRRSLSKEGLRPGLRKSVSFDSGTKIPDDYEESTPTHRDNRRERTRSPERAYEHSHPHKSPNQVPDMTPEECQEAFMQQARAEAADTVPELPTEIESPDSDAHDNFPCSHVAKSSRCQRCHHCPPKEPYRGRGRKKPDMQTRRPETARLSQEEEQLRSVAHSVLLATHQSWCSGSCNDLSKFVQQKGGCFARCQRNPHVRWTGGSWSIPNCRTLIHCHKLGHGIFPAQRSSTPAKAKIDRALRLAYADVYCCYIREYLTPEEYLAYRRGGSNDLDLGLWIQSNSIREHTGLAREVRKTVGLWSEIMKGARQSGKHCREEAVLRVLEDMARI